MKIVFILAMLAMLSVASAEKVQFGNYTATFNMKQPHLVQNDTIKTFDGSVLFTNTNASKILGKYVGYVGGVPHSYGIFVSDCYYYNIAYLGFSDIEIISRMNLTDTVDFLKSLKIEKTKAA